MTSPLLDRTVEREVLEGHDGRSGARIERVRLDDGTRLVVKRARSGEDLSLIATGGVDRERKLWEAGVFGRLPAGVGHAIVEVFVDDDETVTVMRDLGDAIPGWSRTLTRDECRRILHGLSAMHASFLGDVPADLCPLDIRLGLLSPQSMHRVDLPGHPLPALIRKGWERFAELVPDDVASTIAAAHEAPGPLVAAMSAAPQTMLHADLWLVNLGLADDELVLLDWAIATEGPAALDFVIFLTGAAAHVDPTREQLIEDFRAASGELTDDRTLALALVAGLAEMGWNKALDASEHDDPAMRAREQADLDWWVARTREALDRYAL